MRKLWMITLAAAVLGSSPALAINTHLGWDGVHAVSTFGCPDTADYGQVITIPKFKHTLGTFSFWQRAQAIGGIHGRARRGLRLGRSEGDGKRAIRIRSAHDCLHGFQISQRNLLGQCQRDRRERSTYCSLRSTRILTSAAPVTSTHGASWTRRPTQADRFTI